MFLPFYSLMLASLGNGIWGKIEEIFLYYTHCLKREKKKSQFWMLLFFSVTRFHAVSFDSHEKLVPRLRHRDFIGTKVPKL